MAKVTELQNVEEYLEELVRDEFADNGTSDAWQKFQQCTTDRASWDEYAQLAIMVMKNQFPGVQGELTENLKIYFDNYVKRDIVYRINQLLTSDVEIDLTTMKGILDQSGEILENMLNYIADAMDYPDTLSQPISNVLYLGECCQHQWWDTSDIDDFWLTGKPIWENLDPRNFWRDPATTDDKKKDCRYIFVKRTYDTESLRERFPEFADEIQPSQIVIAGGSANFRNTTNNTNLSTTDVLVYQFKRTKYVDIVGISNELEGYMEFFLWSEYEDYLKEKGVIDPLAGMQYEENEVFPEGVVATEKLANKKEEWVYEVLFIPESGIVLQEPKIVGKDFTYVSMSYFHNPDSAYSDGLTKDALDSLEASGIIMTLQLFDAVKNYKPIPIVMAGALINEKDFLENCHKPNAQAIVDPAWQEEHPGIRPVEYLLAPEKTQMLELLQQKLERQTDMQMATPSVVRGVSDSASDSGRSVGLKQSAAASNIRGDFYMLEKFIRKQMEILKYNLCKFRTYEHETLGLDKETMDKGMIPVNTDESNSIKGLHAKTTVKIRIIDNTEAAKIAREQKYLGLFDRGMISYEDAMYKLNLDNPEKLIADRNQQMEDMQLAQIVQANPQLKETILKLVQEGKLQTVSEEEYKKGAAK
jgi:hypothetical protein